MFFAYFFPHTRFWVYVKLYFCPVVTHPYHLCQEKKMHKYKTTFFIILGVTEKWFVYGLGKIDKRPKTPQLVQWERSITTTDTMEIPELLPILPSVMASSSMELQLGVIQVFVDQTDRNKHKQNASMIFACRMVFHACSSSYSYCSTQAPDIHVQYMWSRVILPTSQFVVLLPLLRIQIAFLIFPVNWFENYVIDWEQLG